MQERIQLLDTEIGPTRLAAVARMESSALPCLYQWHTGTCLLISSVDMRRYRLPKYISPYEYVLMIVIVAESFSYSCTIYDFV